MRIGFGGLVATILLAGSEASIVHGAMIQPIITEACTEAGVATPCADVPVLFQTEINGNQVGPGVLSIDWNISADATSTTLSPAAPFTASVQVALTLTAYTTGPIRTGTALYDLGTDGDFGPGGGLTAVAEFDGFSCSGVMCGNGAEVPFTLGVPFQLEVIAGGSVQGMPGAPGEGGGGSASLSLQLFDQVTNGMIVGGPVEILGPTPEPRQVAPLAALLCCAFSWLRRNQPRSVRLRYDP